MTGSCYDVLLASTPPAATADIRLRVSLKCGRRLELQNSIPPDFLNPSSVLLLEHNPRSHMPPHQRSRASGAENPLVALPDILLVNPDSKIIRGVIEHFSGVPERHILLPCPT